MTYKEWYKRHATKHAQLVQSLSRLSKDEIIEYFDFDNMRQKHPEFCPLYADNQKCHDMERLNCYFCACMHFRFDDNGIDNKSREKRVYSYCSIESKNSSKFEDTESIHNDCSNCKVPHKGHVIKKYFHRDWLEVMKHCDLDSEK